MSEHEEAPARPLYEEVERIRLRQGWTKVQLARNAGVSRGTVENWRTQPRAPLAPTIKDVAERLGIPAEKALRLAGIVPPNEPTPRERLWVAMRARVDELGLGWKKALPGRLDITQYPVETLSRRDKRSIERNLRWATDSVDDVLEGGEPTPIQDPPPEDHRSAREMQLDNFRRLAEMAEERGDTELAARLLRIAGDPVRAEMLEKFTRSIDPGDNSQAS